MKMIGPAGALAIVVLSGAALAATSQPSLSFGEKIANMFGGVATRLRTLEQAASDRNLEVSELKKRVTDLEGQVSALKAQTAEATADAQKAVQDAEKADQAASSASKRPAHTSRRN